MPRAWPAARNCILPGIGHDTGRVYHDVGVDGFIWHAKLFDLKPPKSDTKKL
jgi:hypothetical protein